MIHRISAGMMSDDAESRVPGESPHFMELPAELISAILGYLPVRDLAQASGTCRHLREVCSHLGVWRLLGHRLINFGCQPGRNADGESHDVCSVQEQCRIAHNWTVGHCTEQRYIKFKTGLLPWMQLTAEHLYVSVMSHVTRHRLRPNGRFSTHPHPRKDVKYSGHTEDVNKFVVRGIDVISCGRDGRVILWDRASGQRLGVIDCDLSSIQCVDGTRELILGGSVNRGVQVWRRSNGTQLHLVPMADRVWSIRVDPSQRIFATGSSGNTDLNSLKMWDIERAHFLQVFGANTRRGAGILDLHFESPNLLLTAGYDTYVRLWDVRSPRSAVLELEEPSDNAVYCVASDDSSFIAAGSCRHGVVRFWDKRRPDTCIQTFFVCRNTRSPVYSVQFNSHCLYAALSHGIHILDFNGYKT